MARKKGALPSFDDVATTNNTQEEDKKGLASYSQASDNSKDDVLGDILFEKEKEKKKPQFFNLDPDVVEALNKLNSMASNTGAKKTSKKSAIVNTILRHYLEEKGYLK